MRISDWSSDVCSSDLHLDQHTRLVVGVGGESLALLGRHSGVALDERSHHTASSLDTEGQWSNVQEQQVLELLALVVARKDGSLHGGTVCDGLVRVDALAQVLSVDRKGVV